MAGSFGRCPLVKNTFLNILKKLRKQNWQRILHGSINENYTGYHFSFFIQPSQQIRKKMWVILPYHKRRKSLKEGLFL
jgi:hypothetical protein